MENTVIFSKSNPMDKEIFEQYFALLQLSFPTSERRDYAGHLGEFSEDRFSSLCYIPDKLGGFINWWDFGDFVYVEHFAVEPQLRGNGTGSALMNALRSTVGEKPLVLEVEPPQDSEIAAHRVNFYKRLGFEMNSFKYIQPPLIKGEKPIPLCIMSAPAALSQSDFSRIVSAIHKYVYKADEGMFKS